MKSFAFGLAGLFLLGGLAVAQDNGSEQEAKTIQVWEADIRGIGG